MTVLLFLLTCHFIGDFLLQSNWMALNKSQSTFIGLLALTWHAEVYALTFAVGILVCLWPVDELWYSIDWSRFCAFVGLTFVTHWVTDFVTSRWTARLRPYEPLDRAYQLASAAPPPIYYPVEAFRQVRDPHWFFVAIGFDQVIHVWTLALTYLWCIR